MYTYFPAAIQVGQALNEANLPCTAEIKRPANTVGAGGTVDKSLVTVASGVRCGLAFTNSFTEQAGGRLHQRSEWLVRFRLDTDVRVDDRIVVTGPNGLVTTVAVRAIRPRHPASLMVRVEAVTVDA